MRKSCHLLLNKWPHSHAPEQYLDFAVSFGGRGGIACSTDVIEGQGGPPRLGESRHLDLVAHILVVRMDGVGPLVSRQNEVWSESKYESFIRSMVKKGALHTMRSVPNVGLKFISKIVDITLGEAACVQEPKF